MRQLLAPLMLLFLAAPLVAKEAPPKPLVYPETRKTDDFDEMHGEKILDPYRWLEPDQPEEVVAWDNAQNEVFRKHVDGYPERAAIWKRLEAEMAMGGLKSLPTFEGGKRFYTYRAKGENQAVLYVTSEDESAEPKVVLNPNTWNEDQTASVQAWKVSPNGRYVAYRRDDKGSEETTLYIKDLETGETLPEFYDRTKHGSIVWAADSSGFFYSRMPLPGSVPKGQEQHNRRIYWHKLGTLPVDDPIVYGQGRPALESGWPYMTSDKKHLLIARGLPYRSVDTLELKMVDGRPELIPLNMGDGSRTWIDRVGDTYVINSDRYSGNREIFTAQATADGGIGRWTKVPFPAGKTGVVKDFYVVGERYLLCHIRQNVMSRLYVASLMDPGIREIRLPEPGTVNDVKVKHGDSRIWFMFQSYSRPHTIYRCNLADTEPELVREAQLPTNVKVDELVSQQTTYTSKDGTKIPIFLLSHKDTKLDGSSPTVLYGYGGFRVGMYPRFSRSRGIWAEMGGVFAVACLRGGDEFGEDWHQAGCLGNKQNVYDDFIAAADWLVEKGYASRGNLAIQGGSNGGLLVAVCINQRPDLAGAVICGVPLTDMLRYHRFQFAKSWTKEYGDPDVKEEFDWIRPYSPYHNAPRATYPALLVTAGLVDGRVNAFHARKMAAVWQEKSTSGEPVLLRIDRKGGHGAANVTRAYQEILDEWCFLLRELKHGE